MDDLKEHSKIIENFVASVRRQLKDHACCVYSNNIQYKCNLKEKEVTVVPDASISCRVYNKRKSSFLIFQGLYWKLFLHLQSNMIIMKKRVI